jgi:hypothetical protein
VYITRYLDFFVTLHLDFLHIYNAIMKLFFIASEALVLFFMTKKYRASYDPRMDSFRILILIVPAVVLAFLTVNTRFAHTVFQYICEVLLPSLLQTFVLIFLLVCMDFFYLFRSRCYFTAIVSAGADR